MTDILNQKLIAWRSQIDEIIKDLHQLTISIGHEELAETVSELRNRVNEPFMFVIVGEVKAGKSSFVNALLDTGREVTKAAPQPMTDTIQQIVYGEKEEVISINPYLKKITLPVEILKEIAIVDTPGTNTIVDHHQEITERFIPAADLIVFVFEAKNPYRQSAWQFFDYINEEWQRKVIFVLQQKDLMESDDLAVNYKGVQDYAAQKGINAPLVFKVSAKQELEGQKEISGFVEMRDYIQQNITGGKAPILKLQNSIATSHNINERIQTGLNDRQQQLEADVIFRNDIRQTLDRQEVKSANQVDVLVEHLLAVYDKITTQKERELEEGLGFFSLLKRSFTAMFTTTPSAKDWLEQLAGNMETELNQLLKQKLNDGVVDLADSIQQMAKMIDLKIQHSTTILRNNHDIFSDIAERRSNVLRDLQDAFSRFMERSENFNDKQLLQGNENIAPNIAAGGGMAVIGVILAAVTNGAVFDITGGVLTTVGLLFAGASTTMKRRKVLNGFHAEIAKGRLQMEQEVNEKLKTYIRHIKEKIDANFNEFDQHLKREKDEIELLEARQRSIENRLSEVSASIVSPTA
ncbi:MAG: dynamin family protein [Bacteroidota bacterium]